MISVVCFQWNSGFRTYLPRHVNALAAMYKANYPGDLRFICITDETEGFSADVELYPTPAEAKAVADIPSPHGNKFPSSYRRLWLFSEQAKALGERILLTDIDCIVWQDVSPLFDSDADFVGWRTQHKWGRVGRIGGGSWLLKTGTHTHVWDEFAADPAKLIHQVATDGWAGSDQAILSYMLQGCAVWPDDIGIYQNQDNIHRWREPPTNARIIHFNGKVKPWHSDSKWVVDALKRYEAE